MMLALASIVCVFVWLQQQSRPDITSNTLLVRAERWDADPYEPVPPAVICQTVRIKAQKRTVERAIYRDAQGQRHLKKQTLPPDDQRLKVRLENAGVSWDAPLSATGYQQWHDRQRVRQDEIKRSGRHLLELTTTTPEGEISAQTFTVRDTDFHPVDRTISFRDNETVEIAELNYEVLPWNPATTNLFEPLGAAGTGELRRTRTSQILHLPVSLDATQLDEAELSARLALNELHADTGEEIRLERTPSGIRVTGIVETEDRRRELMAQLGLLSHVEPSILSIERLKQNLRDQPAAANVRMDSVSVNPSPLETYFVARGRDADALRELSQGLLNSAITASQESRSIADLLNRFSADGAMNDVARATLAELIFVHREKLMAALDEERRLLGEAAGNPDMERLPGVTGRRADSLVNAANRNLSLCEELALGSSGQPRNAELIFPELIASMNDLGADARQAQNGFQEATARSGKR
ncbi:hypothetical protein [Paracidobacterium acidisoli]|uniref:Uncharacterized protein n=1 Tax=Paracidobacterium acidisoli TaxID=2303751 RepID=A0A372IJS8_9BACT|nr:hypothetical protein [Paracidobacterium acidisoli]MBT9333106.1 hypothetical protein [Paracidobacterium acidisoli]